MGIKNIHIILISASVLVSVVFGIWSLNNHYQILGYISLVSAVGLIVYGINFLKKVKTL